MKVSKILVPAVALMATNNYVYTNNKVVASCETICSEMLSHCILCCTSSASIPLLSARCYTGCFAGYGICMAACAAAK